MIPQYFTKRIFRISLDFGLVTDYISSMKNTSRFPKEKIMTTESLHLGLGCFDSDGYDRDGYNVDGLDYAGYDRDGYDVDGFDRGGYDVTGFGRDGFDRAGGERLVCPPNTKYPGRVKVQRDV